MPEPQAMSSRRSFAAVVTVFPASSRPSTWRTMVAAMNAGV
jgi:hypothetical protein